MYSVSSIWVQSRFVLHITQPSFNLRSNLLILFYLKRNADKKRKNEARKKKLNLICPIVIENKCLLWDKILNVESAEPFIVIIWNYLEKSSQVLQQQLTFLTLFHLFVVVLKSHVYLIDVQTCREGSTHCWLMYQTP